MGNYPKILFYMIDILCNERCSKCSHWKYNSQRTFFDVSRLTKFINSIDSIEEFDIVGGEPLIYRDDIVKLLSGIRTYIKTTIITNGVLANKEFIDNVANYNVHFVFSIDTISKDYWNFIRGKDTFDIVMRNFNYALKKLKPEQISIQSVLALETKSYIEDVKKWADSIGIYHGIQDYISDGFDGNWIALEKNQASSNEPCFAYLNNMSIMPNGDIYTCFQQNMIAGCEKPIGNINNTKYLDIINNQYFLNVIEKMKTCNLPCKVLKCNVEKG